MHLKLGSRKSRLAIWQTEQVAQRLQASLPDITTEIVTMDTLGDKILDKPLPKIGAKGLFTQELEQALFAGEIDLAVHSLKDLPSSLPPGLEYAGSLERAAPTDALISARWERFEDVPEDGTIATGSLRRKAQLLSQKPGLSFENLRGNIDTRLQKLRDNGWDGIIMATAALHRLGRADLVSIELPPETFVPAVSQGAIGIEIASKRDEIRELTKTIAHAPTVEAVTAERIFMRRLEGGCSVPLGAYCQRDGTNWTFRAWVGSTDGSRVLTDVSTGSNPNGLAEAMASDFINRGAAEILGR